MTEPPRDYYDEVERRGGHFRDQAFEFDKLAVAYSQKGFETLTYLNGGALVGLPAALAFFKADIPVTSIIYVGIAFIAGLLLVVVAQIMAFFTMAKRAEGQEHKYFEQIHLIAAAKEPGRQVNANQSFANAEVRRVRSNQVRLAGLVCFVLSLLSFIVGCSLGAIAVVTARGALQH